MPAAAVLEAIAFIRGLQATPYGRAAADAGFDVLVLCASEFQPPAKLFPGVHVIQANMKAHGEKRSHGNRGT